MQKLVNLDLKSDADLKALSVSCSWPVIQAIPPLVESEDIQSNVEIQSTGGVHGDPWTSMESIDIN